jgi:RNA polymerase sigma-70 factor (ECF subfamily)
MMERRQPTSDTKPADVPAELESDLELLRELNRRAEGDPADPVCEKAWQELVERHKNRVYRIALHISRNPQVAEEITQEVFFDLFRTWRKGWEARQNLRGWLSAVTVRKAVRAVRKRRKVALETKELTTEPPARETADERLRTEAQNVAMALVGELPENLRLPVVMYYAGEMKQNEIARELRCSQNVVSERLQRALEQLKVGMRKAGFDSLPATFPALLSQALAIGSAPPTVVLEWAQCVNCAAEQSVKAVSGLSAGKVAVIALAVIFLASAGGVYLHLKDDVTPGEESLPVTKETPPPQSTSDQPKNQSEPAQASLLLSWAFDAPPEKFEILPYDIQLFPGDYWGDEKAYPSVAKLCNHFCFVGERQTALSLH